MCGLGFCLGINLRKQIADLLLNQVVKKKGFSSSKPVFPELVKEPSQLSVWITWNVICSNRWVCFQT